MIQPTTCRFATTLIALAMIGTTMAETIDVPGTYTSIQEAVDAASDGDVVLVGPGTYTSSSDQVVDLDGKQITLRSSSGPAVTIIDGEKVRRGIRCFKEETPESIIDGFTITRCASLSDGGGIACEKNSSPTILDCVVIANTTLGQGGGIAILNSNPTLSHCIIANNKASTHGGGIATIGSEPSFTQCTIANNNASSHGGGLAIDHGSALLVACTITGNRAVDPVANRHGGGIACEDGSLDAINCTITGNTASTYGGGVYCTSSELTLADTCTISSNSSRSGGGLYCIHGRVTFNDCIVSNNNASDSAGGLYGNHLLLEVNNSTFEFNQSVNFGGGMCVKTKGGDIDDDTIEDYAVRITNCVFRGNVADSGGGLQREHRQEKFSYVTKEPPYEEVIVYSDSKTEITGCTFENNKAWINGGGLHLLDGHYYWNLAPEIDTSPTISNCTFTGNTAMDGAGGGFWASDSSTYIESCTFEKNHANRPVSDPNEYAGYGGGASFVWHSVDTPDEPVYATFAPQLMDCHFIGNTANFDGGGLYLDHAGHNLNSNGCVFDSNHAGHHGGGLHGGSQGFTITNGTFTANKAVERGGGIHCLNSVDVDEVVEIVHSCLFTSNEARDGGGIACEAADTQIIQCTFDSNTAERSGGGVQCDLASLVSLTDCLFLQNDAADLGGGFSGHGSSSPILDSCTFLGNTASGQDSRGGGIACVNLAATNCNMTNNTAVRFGGGIACLASVGLTPICTITGSTISGNFARDGGGVHAGEDTSPMLNACIIVGNEAQDTGGGISGRGKKEPPSILTIEECTIADNSAPNGGGIAFSIQLNDIHNSLASSMIRGNDCQDDATQITGDWIDLGNNDVLDDDCPCPGDIDGNGAVAVDDILEVINQWGQPGGPADVDGDGTVGVNDVLLVIGEWGFCE